MSSHTAPSPGRRIAAAIFALTLAMPGRGDAAPSWQPAPEWRLLLNNLLLVRYNPLGLEDQIRFGVQKRLYHHQGAALRDNFLFVGVSPRVTPAFVKIGPSLEVQPLSVFNLRVAAEVIAWFSTFDFLQSYPSPLAPHSAADIARGGEAGRNYATRGVHLMIEPLVQLRFGDLIVRDKLALEYWSMRLRPGDTVYFDPTLDTLVAHDGWVIANDLDVLYRAFGDRLTAGVRYAMVQPLYRAADYAPGEDAAANPNGHHRVGPLVAWTFYDRGPTALNKPTLILIAGWYLRHRYRAGAEVSRALPNLLVGLSFQSDLLQ